MSSDPSQLAVNGGKPVREELLPSRKTFGEEEIQEVKEALESGSLFYAGGSKVYGFLDRARKLFGAEGIVACSSGTAAIHVALGAVNLNPGDEVIVPPVTDMGSIAPIILSGGIPVFVDVEPDTFNTDPNDLADKITDRTKAVIVVHCWGRPANLDAILDAVKGRDIRVIEDCAQAHYVKYRDRIVGTIGDFGTFSFQQSKHITSGDGGMTIVNRPECVQRAELFVDKGCDWTKDRVYRKTYAFISPCYRMTELQGAVLNAQIERLPGIIEKRQQIGGRIAAALADLPGVVPPPVPDDVYGHGYWGFPLRVVESELGASRDDFVKALAAEGIKADTWITKPLYLYDALANQITLGDSHWPFRGAGRDVPEYGEGLCPNAETVLSQLANVVRIHEHLTEPEQQDVIDAVRKVASGLSASA